MLSQPSDVLPAPISIENISIDIIKYWREGEKESLPNSDNVLQRIKHN